MDIGRRRGFNRQREDDEKLLPGTWTDGIMFEANKQSRGEKVYD